MIPIDSEIALAFFLRFTLGHFVGDFFLQPYWLVLAKRKGWTGLVIHVGVVTFVTAILAWGVIPIWWVWIIVLFIGHLFIDQFRTFIFVDNTKGKGLALLLLDQAAHVALIMLISWAATGWTFSDLSLLLDPNVPDQYLVMSYLIAAAILISVAPVLEVEITVAVWATQGQETNQTVKIDTEDRVYGGAERILAVILILLGFGLLAPLVFVPRLLIMIYRGYAKEDRTAVTTKVLTSFASALIVAIVLINIAMPKIFV